MPTVIVFDPMGSAANTIYGINNGVSNSHDPSVTYDGIYFGLGGGDTIYDTDANGWIWASTSRFGSVSFYGQGGNDVLVSFDGADRLYGGTGNDILISNADDDQLFGEAGNDQLWGGGSFDRLDGGDGEDWVIGGGGGLSGNRDILWGGDHDLSRDIIIGAQGSLDTFISSGNSQVATEAQTDIVWYFTLGEDLIQLRGASNSSPRSDATGSLNAKYVGNFDGTGLAGTLLSTDVAGVDPIMFLAGVRHTAAQLENIVTVYNG